MPASDIVQEPQVIIRRVLNRSGIAVAEVPGPGDRIRTQVREGCR